MTTTTKPRILCVDDEPNVLEGLARTLRDRFDVDTAVGGPAGLEKLTSGRPYAVIVTDMRMPEVDGVAVLRAARERTPDTTRVLLTGQADLHSAIAAVNDGNIFRFLVKPCPTAQLRKALDAAVEQERLVRAERELLQETLKGAVKLCIDILSLVHPESLSRASRVRRIAAMLAAGVVGAEQWTIELAALLAHIGAVTLPAPVLEKLHKGATLTLGEVRLIEPLPAIGAQLVSAIPRLEPVSEILLFQRTWYDGTHSPKRGVSGEAIPIGARVLLLAHDYDVLESRELSTPSRMRVLESRKGVYDPQLLAKLRDVLTRSHDEQRTDDGVMLRLEQVQLGMVFTEDVPGPNGLTLIGRGQEVTHALRERIRLLPAPYRERVVKMQPVRNG